MGQHSASGSWCQPLSSHSIFVLLQHIGYTPLHKAAFSGQAEVIRVLAEANVNMEATNIVSVLPKFLILTNISKKKEKDKI